MDPRGVPDIAALIYGSGRVLLPEMHWDSTSELLDMFALAELIRQQTVVDATDALSWNKFYRKDGATAADGEPLTGEERKTLKAIVNKYTGLIHRDTFRTVVMQVCWAVSSLCEGRIRKDLLCAEFCQASPPPSPIK